MSNIDIFIWEFLGTTVLCLLGSGSVAAVVLKNSYSHGGGGDWLIIVFGWGFGVFAGASIAAPSGAHINPAVTLAVAISGGIPWSSVPVYWAAQLLGGIIGSSLAHAAGIRAPATTVIGAVAGFVPGHAVAAQPVELHAR